MYMTRKSPESEKPYTYYVITRHDETSTEALYYLRTGSFAPYGIESAKRFKSKHEAKKKLRGFIRHGVRGAYNIQKIRDVVDMRRVVKKLIEI